MYVWRKTNVLKLLSLNPFESYNAFFILSNFARFAFLSWAKISTVNINFEIVSKGHYESFTVFSTSFLSCLCLAWLELAEKQTVQGWALSVVSWLHFQINAFLLSLQLRNNLGKYETLQPPFPGVFQEWLSVGLLIPMNKSQTVAIPFPESVSLFY